jgi:hypothetical protein
VAQLLKTTREKAEVETLVAAQEWQQDSPAQLADKEKEKKATMSRQDKPVEEGRADNRTEIF